MYLPFFQKKTNRKTPEKTSQMLELERINRRQFRLGDQSPVKSPMLGVSSVTVGRTTHNAIGANSLKTTRMFQTSAWVSYKPSGVLPSLPGFPIQKGWPTCKMIFETTLTLANRRQSMSKLMLTVTGVWNLALKTPNLPVLWFRIGNVSSTITTITDDIPLKMTSWTDVISIRGFQLQIPTKTIFLPTMHLQICVGRLTRGLDFKWPKQTTPSNPLKCMTM